MRAIIEKGQLQLEIVDLFEGLNTDELMQVADSLAITDQVISFVVQQILDGWTELNSHGGRLAGASPSPSTGLDRAVREIAKRSSEVVKEEIERLEKALKSKQDEVDHLRKTIAELKGLP